jgi:hypothetical protein
VTMNQVLLFCHKSRVIGKKMSGGYFISDCGPPRERGKGEQKLIKVYCIIGRPSILNLPAGKDQIYY